MPRQIDQNPRSLVRHNRSTRYTLELDASGNLVSLSATRVQEERDGSTVVARHTLSGVTLLAADVPNGFKNQLSAIEALVDVAEANRPPDANPL